MISSKPSNEPLRNFTLCDLANHPVVNYWLLPYAIYQSSNESLLSATTCDLANHPMSRYLVLPHAIYLTGAEFCWWMQRPRGPGNWTDATTERKATCVCDIWGVGIRVPQCVWSLLWRSEYLRATADPHVHMWRFLCESLLVLSEHRLFKLVKNCDKMC